MAIPQNEQQTEQQQQQQNNPLFLLESLYCEEEKWEVEEELDHDSLSYNNGKNPSFFPFLFFEQELFWEDNELHSLFSKEQEQKHQTHVSSFSVNRSEAVEWMLKVNAHYGFSSLTAILAINYLDRFLFSPHFQREKPWMIQLVAVACLSLAAKVEEIQVPLLLDLQVEDTRYVFEAKTIQRMELLVLSTLQWRMHPVTPVSFVDHIMRRLGLKNNLHLEFLKRCESLLLSLVSDSRSICYLPSVLATATMIRVIDQVEACSPSEYQDQLLDILNPNRERVNDCYNLILELSSTNYNPHKRKNEEEFPGSPGGVIDAVFSSDSSNDSWVVGSSAYSSAEPPLKKRRAQDQQMKLPSLLNRVFVDIVTSPP